jgi:threonine dehydrogenase-like Zn-dependent dehydrogenase
LGHEIAGEVAAVGDAAVRVRPGDRVTIDQVVGCGTCFFCRRGSHQFCRRGFELGITRDGGCQDYVVLPEQNVYPIPDCVSFEAAAVLDMEVWAALRKCGVHPGEAVLVIGHGPAGLVACQLLRAMGAGKVILCGRSAARLARAEALGLADIYVSSAEDDLLEAVRRETDGNGASLVFECAGARQSVINALAAAVPGGRVVLYGVQPDLLDRFDLNAIVLRDLVVYGALSDRRGWEEVIELARTGLLKLDPLITHRFPLECAPAAYELVRDKADGVVKAVLLL